MLNIRSKRASIPVTLLVILVLALYVAALLTFAIIGVRESKGVQEGYQEVQELNVKTNNKGILGGGIAEPERIMRKGEIMFEVREIIRG